MYSGKISTGKTILNATRGKKERLGRILRIHADKREDVKDISAGQIAAAVGLKETCTGDTLCAIEHPIVLESIYAPDPVINVAIEPKTPLKKVVGKSTPPKKVKPRLLKIFKKEVSVIQKAVIPIKIPNDKYNPVANKIVNTKNKKL